MADLQIGNPHGVTATSAGTAAVGSREVVTLTVDATGGTFTLTVDGGTTSALAYNISAANLETAINALLDGHEVEVADGPGDDGGTTPYVITFVTLTGDFPDITADDALLTGGAGTATVVETEKGDEEVYTNPPNLGNTYTDADLMTIGTMKTRLAAIDAGYYTTDQLNSMTYNDMVYAIRLADNPNTIRQ